jgi:hypothetical protein
VSTSNTGGEVLELCALRDIVLGGPVRVTTAACTNTAAAALPTN